MQEPLDANYRSYHDMGGLPAGPIGQGEHSYDLWEKRVDALMVLLSSPDRKLLRVDELRRAIETLAPEDYDRLSYYQRWIRAITAIMLEKQIVGADELQTRIAALKAAGTGRGAA